MVRFCVCVFVSTTKQMVNEGKHPTKYETRTYETLSHLLRQTKIQKTTTKIEKTKNNELLNAAL